MDGDELPAGVVTDLQELLQRRLEQIGQLIGEMQDHLSEAN